MSNDDILKNNVTEIIVDDLHRGGPIAHALESLLMQRGYRTEFVCESQSRQSLVSPSRSGQIDHSLHKD